MLSEKMMLVGQEAYEYAPEVAKYERVARAAKILAADYHCFDNSLPDVWDELEAALADLGALGG